jgi:hypothetical protein
LTSSILPISSAAESITRTVDNAADPLLLRGLNQLRQLCHVNTRRQAAANHKDRAALNGEHFLFQSAEFISGQGGARHHKTVLLAAGLNVDMQVLPGPVVRFDALRGNMFIGEQRR